MYPPTSKTVANNYNCYNEHSQTFTKRTTDGVTLGDVGDFARFRLFALRPGCRRRRAIGDDHSLFWVWIWVWFIVLPQQCVEIVFLALFLLALLLLLVCTCDRKAPQSLLRSFSYISQLTGSYILGKQLHYRLAFVRLAHLRCTSFRTRWHRYCPRQSRTSSVTTGCEEMHFMPHTNQTKTSWEG